MEVSGAMVQPFKRFQILSLDGGGIKGILSAAVLAAIENDLEIDVTEHFDLITGTSTGGIIALGLGLGMRPRDIVEFYVDQGSTIFGNRLGWRWLHKWLLRKYPQKRLRSALHTCFGDKTLADSRKRLVIPAYSLGDDDIYLFRTPHDPKFRRDWRVPAWQVGVATGAAPTFFSCCRHVDSLRLIDGGVWANNPAMVGVIEAINTLRQPLESIHVLSLGTTDPVTHRRKRLNYGGILQWAAGGAAIDVIMRGQSIGTSKQVRLLLGDDRYERLDPRVADGEFALDKHAGCDDLIGKAAHHSRRLVPRFEEKFQPHKSEPYQPLYPAAA